MLKRSFIIVFMLFISLVFGEDIAPTAETYIELVAEEGFGYIELSWELHGITEFEKLELIIINGIETEKIIDITNKTNYFLGRGFTLDNDGNYNEISVGIVSTIPVKKKVGVEYYTVGMTYLTSVMIITAPLSFPSPQDVQYENGELTCELLLSAPELINRFYGFKVDNKEYKSSYKVSGFYNIQIGKQGQPSKISALFKSTDEPILMQSSKLIQIPVSTEVIDIADTNLTIVQEPDSDVEEITSLTSELVVMNEEDIIPTDDLYINLQVEVRFGYLKYNWEIQGLPSYEKLEMKIQGRTGSGDETIDLTDVTSVTIDRKFYKDEMGCYKEISVWLVATIERKKKIGVKYYKTSTGYLGSNSIVQAPLGLPSPEVAKFGQGKIACKLTLTSSDLINRFYGFKIDGKEYKINYNSNGFFDVKYNKKSHPKMIAALYYSIDKPTYKQESKLIGIDKIDFDFDSLPKANSNDDKISYIEADMDEPDEIDAFHLAVEKSQEADIISISWSKIADAEFYFIYRSPAQDSLYRVYEANSLPASQSARYNRLRFDNNLHVNSITEKQKLKSGNVYSYCVNAKNMFDDLGTSNLLSVYYYNGPNGSFAKEVKQDSVSFNSMEKYQMITSNQFGITKALETKNYEKLVSDFVSNSDSLGFDFFYIELQPYNYLESGNDGFLDIDEVIRAFLPKEFANDIDLLALMKIINFDEELQKQIIINNKITTDGIIKVPLPAEMARK
jgi:hypothetical protein